MNRNVGDSLHAYHFEAGMEIHIDLFTHFVWIKIVDIQSAKKTLPVKP